MLVKCIKKIQSVAISYVDTLISGESGEYVSKEKANYVELAFKLNDVKFLYVLFDMDGFVIKLEFGDGKRSNRIILFFRNYSGETFINEKNLKNIDFEVLNFYLDYYNNFINRNDLKSKNILLCVHNLIIYTVNYIKNNNPIYTITKNSMEYEWVATSLSIKEIDYLNKCCNLNTWKNVHTHYINSIVYSKNISVLPPDIRPDINPNYCIIQTQIGCKLKDTRKKACAFCSSFLDRKYKENNEENIKKQIKCLQKFRKYSTSKANTAFLSDGDAVGASNVYELASLIHKLIPNISYFESFITTHDILNISNEKWNQLKKIGFRNFYWGVESADDTTLRFLDKPQSLSMLEKAKKILEDHNISYSVICMCGLSKIKFKDGKNRLIDHVNKTCQFVNECKCQKVYLSKLSIIKNSQLYKLMIAGEFYPMNDSEIEDEYRTMIGLIDKNVNGSYGSQFVI